MKKTLLIITITFIMMVCIIGTSSRLDARIDPLRIIRAQTPPNAVAYVVMDTTGSLSFPVAFDDTGNDSYTTSNGHYVARWHFQGPTGTSCSSSNYASVMGDFTTQVATSYSPYRGAGQGYWLKATTDTSYSYWYFVPPSRMAIFKNVFGPYITIYHVPEEGDAHYPINPLYGPFTDKCNKPYYRFPLVGGPTGGAYYSWATKAWVNWTPGNTTEPAGDANYTIPELPVMLFQSSSDVIDWGLLKFSNTSATDEVTASTASDQTSIITALNARMNTIVGDPINALDPNGGTCTSMALDLVKAQLNTVYNGDQFKDCRRYVAILITDGQSNTCNCCGCSGSPGEDEAWGNTCPNYTNLTTLKKYPPGRTDEIFLKGADSTVTCCTHSNATTARNFQTFAIGVSDAVAKCELNLDAYMGRTDAANPDDAGLDYANDTDATTHPDHCTSIGNHCLPTNTTGATSLANYVAVRNYAFFSNNAQDIQDAFGNIIAALTKGDYSVSDPVAVQSIAGTGSILLSSTRTPGWFGTIRRWDIADPDSTDTSNHQPPVYHSETWCDEVNDTGTNPQHIIYFSGDRTQKHFHLIWDAGCSLKKQYVATNNVDHNRKVYTVATACNTGTSSGPSSACQNVLALQKNDATVSWLRANINTPAWWQSFDFNNNGVNANTDNDDVKMLIDWILGGQGTVAAGDPRFWLIADIINGTPVTIGRPLPYTLGKNIPYKGSFDAIHYGRKKIVYLPSNDGMIHALMFDHNPRDINTTQNIELFAFLSPQAFNNVALMLKNYLIQPNGSTTYPVGQKPDINFDYHYWNVSAPPSYADIWANWAISGAGDWRTILFVPLGPTQNGVYALDVTDPTKVLSPNPMVSVLWYWNGADLPSSPAFTKEVWSVMPIGISQAGGKVGNAYKKWIVGLSGTQSSDVDTNNITAIVQADTGQSLTDKILLPPSPAGMVPFHAYGNVTFMESDYPIYLPDALVTHTFNSDTAGRIHTLKLNYDNPASWVNNTPPVPLNYGTSNPIHYSPSVAHGVQTDAMVLASITGSIFETDMDMNGASSTFTTKAYLDVLDVNKTSWNVSQPDASKQHREWPIVGNYMVDTNGDGTPDTTEYLSQLTRATNRPLLVVSNGVNGTVYYLVFDIMHLNPEFGVCTGKSYLYPVNFVLQKFTTGSAGAGFTSASPQPMLSLAYGVVTGITSGSEKIVAGVTGYGVNGVAMPEFTPYGDFTPPNTLPRLRSVKRLL